MNTQSQVTKIELPKLIPTFKLGFDTVANRISLILLPVILDLFLWFGPHFSLNQLLQPFIKQITTFPGLDTPDMSQTASSIQTLWQTIAEKSNLGIAIRTFPVGVPSLLFGQSPLQTPLGNAHIIEIPSYTLVIGWWLVFIIGGLILGSIFFNQLSREIFREKTAENFHHLTWVILQVFLLTFAFIVLIIVFSIPAMILVPVLALINPGVAQFLLPFFALVLIWLLVPLFFSPHGIFAYHQNAIISMLTSTRLVRASLPGSGLFLLAVLVFGQGLDVLWSIPPATSWLALVGIAGHAFISTSLLAASFVYYRDIMHWAQSTIQQKQANTPPAPNI
jgi:hypothetical protein